MTGQKNALVLGASGISGWAFVNEMLHDYPRENVWAKVHAVTNRPLSIEKSLWPNDPRLKIASGIDLLNSGQGDLENLLLEKIPDISDVTHVIYTGITPQIPASIDWRAIESPVEGFCFQQ